MKKILILLSILVLAIIGGYFVIENFSGPKKIKAGSHIKNVMRPTPLQGIEIGVKS